MARGSKGGEHIGQVGGITDVLDLQLTTDTGGAYASGDVLCNTLELPNAFPGSAPYTGVIQSVTLQDDDDQAGAIDLVFFAANSSLGTANGAVSMVDNDNILGIVNIAAADYDDMINSQHCTKTNVGIVVESTNTSLWVGAVSRDTKTYSSTNAISIKVGILQDGGG